MAMNSYQYVSDILNHSFNQTIPKVCQYGYFQLENAAAHTADNSKDTIHELRTEQSAKDSGLLDPLMLM